MRKPKKKHPVIFHHFFVHVYVPGASKVRCCCRFNVSIWHLSLPHQNLFNGFVRKKTAQLRPERAFVCLVCNFCKIKNNASLPERPWLTDKPAGNDSSLAVGVSSTRAGVYRHKPKSVLNKSKPQRTQLNLRLISTSVSACRRPSPRHQSPC